MKYVTKISTTPIKTDFLPFHSIIRHYPNGWNCTAYIVAYRFHYPIFDIDLFQN